VQLVLSSLSAWNDLDFEQLHYDYAHLGTSTIEHREIQIRELSGRLSLTAVDNNPFWGGGLLSLLRIKPGTMEFNKQRIPINHLNICDCLTSNAPTFGAWCKDDDKYIFVTFAPNFLKGLPRFTENLIYWSSVRAYNIKSLVEALQTQRPA
jgi:hypothetical protein